MKKNAILNFHFARSVPSSIFCFNLIPVRPFSFLFCFCFCNNLYIHAPLSLLLHLAPLFILQVFSFFFLSLFLLFSDAPKHAITVSLQLDSLKPVVRIFIFFSSEACVIVAAAQTSSVFPYHIIIPFGRRWLCGRNLHTLLFASSGEISPNVMKVPNRPFVGQWLWRCWKSGCF